MLPSPTDLTYFAEVATQKNLSQAAKVLNITQPSLTLAMQRVEEAVGAPILIRHKRGVILTKAGEQLLADTRSLLHHWQEVKGRALNSMNEVQGIISIGCHPSVAICHLGNIIPELTKQHPKLQLRLEHDISRRITDQVIQLNVDIAIAVNPLQHQDLVIKSLKKDEVKLWGKMNGQIICDPALTQSQFILKMIKSERIITSSNLEVIAHLTKAGAGAAILPSSVAKRFHLKPIPGSPVFKDEICLIYRGENRNVKAIQVICEAIKKSIG